MLGGTLGHERGGAIPLVHGVAQLAARAFGGGSHADLLALIGPEPACAAGRAGWLMDRSWAHALAFSPGAAARLQAEALSLARVFRLRGTPSGPRLLAFCAPGDLMANAPLDFVTEPAGVRLDLAFLAADGTMPAAVPEHDVAIAAAGEGAPAVLAALGRVADTWPRPVLNHPQRIPHLSRTWLPRLLAGRPGLLAAPAAEIGRAELAASGPQAALPDWHGAPYLLRPIGTHGGQGLVRIDGPAGLHAALESCDAASFTLTAFIDYRGGDGCYRKYRIALVEGRPFICHMAISAHWMVHYLNAGMDADGGKRAAEAAAMQDFASFAHRHAAAFAGLVEAVGLDYFSVDCAEAPDGRLLVFEADTAAILHSMDSPDRYPYKRPAMQRCYDAFGTMVRQRAQAATVRH